MLGEVGLRGGFHLGGCERHLGALEVDLTVAGNGDDDELAGAVQVGEREHHVLEGVRGGPGTIGTRHIAVRDIDERGDGRGVRGVVDGGIRLALDRQRRGHDRRERLHVRRVAAGRTHEGVLADGRGVQELLGPRPAHEAVVGGDDHVVETEAAEDAFVRVALRLVRDVEPGIGVIEGVGVLHRELAATQEARARARLVAVLVLDLEDRERQVLVRRVEVLHEQREDLLVGGGEQVVGALAVLQTEDAVAVGLPAATRLVGVAGQERREQHLLRAGRGHLLADDALDVGPHPQAERQPREHTRGLATDVAGADEQPVAGHLGVDGILAEGADEELAETGGHPNTIAAPALLEGRLGAFREREDAVEGRQRRPLLHIRDIRLLADPHGLGARRCEEEEHSLAGGDRVVGRLRRLGHAVVAGRRHPELVLPDDTLVDLVDLEAVPLPWPGEQLDAAVRPIRDTRHHQGRVVVHRLRVVEFHPTHATLRAAADPAQPRASGEREGT